MAEWITCSSCGLKHSARADGTCPRCASPVSGAFVPAPAAPPGPAAQPPVYVPPVIPPERFPVGARIAGWVLFANAMVAIVAMIKAGAQPTDPRSGFGGLVPLLVDVLVGSFLVGGKEKVRPWAVVRVAAGALVLTPILWSNAGPALGLMQLAFSLGLLLLLVGRAGATRIALGLGSAAGTLLLLLGVLTSPPLAARVTALAADLFSREPYVEIVDGSDGRWRLPLPPDRWRETTRLARSVERGFVWAERRAAVAVMVKPLGPGVERDVQRFAAAVVGGLQRGAPAFREYERRTVEAPQGDAVAIRYSIGGENPENGWIVLHASATQFGLVSAYGPPDASEELLEELLGIARSLDLDPEPAGAE